MYKANPGGGVSGFATLPSGYNGVDGSKLEEGGHPSAVLARRSLIR
jgi:hypothetical protein